MPGGELVGRAVQEFLNESLTLRSDSKVHIRVRTSELLLRDVANLARPSRGRRDGESVLAEPAALTNSDGQ